MKEQLKNYRKNYERWFGIKIPKGFEIHHIDFDHYNNDISNLIMLPRELHQEYHKAIYEINGLNNDKATIYGKININGGSFLTNEMINFCKILQEIDKWVSYREYLSYKRQFKEK